MSDQNPNGYEPQGYELKGNLSFRRLNEAAGELARKTDEPQLCGWIYGNALAYQEGEGAYGKFNRIIGEFFAVPYNRSSEINATELFLPGVAERFVIAALNANPGGVPIRMEGWAYPDDSGRKGGTGYLYRVFLRMPPGSVSKARQMAVECGIVEPLPAPPPIALAEAVTYDKETGEIVSEGADAAEAAEEARLKDGLTDLIGPGAGAAAGGRRKAAAA